MLAQINAREMRLAAATCALSAVAAGAATVKPALSLAALGALVVGLGAIAHVRPFTLRVLPAFILIPAYVRLPLPGLPDATPLRLAIFGAFVSWTLMLLFNREESRRLPDGFRMAAAIFTVYVLVIAVPGHTSSINRAVGYSLEALLPVVLVFLSVRDKTTAIDLVDWLIAIVGVAALLAVFELLTQRHLFPERLPFLFHAPDRGGSIRVQGPLPHPIVLGTMIAMILPLAVVRTLTAQDWRRILALGTIGISAIALVATSSRGPWIAAGVALVALVAMLRASQRSAIVAWLLACMAALAVSPFGGTTTDLVRGLVNPDAGQAAGVNTVTYRQQLLRATVDYSKTHPFGIGPGRSGELTLLTSVGGNTTDLSRSIDNAYAKYSLELGPVGLVLFLALLATVLAATRRARRVSDPVLAAIASALLASQIGLLAVSFSVATFTWAQLACLFWILAGLAFAIAQLPQGPAPSWHSLPRAGR